MAGVARTHHLSVVDGESRCEYVCVVAVLAYVARRNMRRVFAGCVHTVVAVNTVAHDIDMVKICWQPGIG